MKRFIFILIIFMSIGSQVIAQLEQELATAFIESLKQKKFALLKPYMADVATVKKMAGNELKGKKDADILRIVNFSNTKISQRWNACLQKVKLMDISQLSIEKVVSAELMEGKPTKGMVIVYNYKGKKWDDLTFVVIPFENRLYIQESPSGTEAFLMEDETLNESRALEAKASQNDPGLKEALSKKVKQVMEAVHAKKINELAALMVYNLPADEKRYWKDIMNPANEYERKAADNLQKRLSNYFGTCAEFTFGKVTVESESEGNWYIIKAFCSNGPSAVFAFLKIKDAFALGEVTYK